MNNGPKQKLKIEIVVAVASVVTGVLLGEGDFARNLVSGITTAIVAVLLTEIWFRYKNNKDKTKTE